ncbi:MAG: hypothetical protein JSV85_02550 [Candidatus Bathyarchaeota archaeon]|nr:MAG: hypothetical protein JSV85_02550 [Candidatus Bathyarchaeota archaeon]
MKKKIFVSFLMITVFLMTLTLSLANAPTDIKEPKCEVILSSHVIMLPTDPGEEEVLETWIYITNPSKEMERMGIGIPGTHHSINVNWVNLTQIWSSGGSAFMQVYPNGTVVTDTGTFYSPGWGDRIRTVVHPMERALVWYSGWQFVSTSQQGIWDFIFKVNVEYEEQTIELVETFHVIAQ